MACVVSREGHWAGKGRRCCGVQDFLLRHVLIACEKLILSGRETGKITVAKSGLAKATTGAPRSIKPSGVSCPWDSSAIALADAMFMVCIRAGYGICEK